MELGALEFADPERVENERTIIFAAWCLRRYPSRHRAANLHPENVLEAGWPSDWLTRVVTILTSVLLDYQDFMPEQLLEAVEFLTTNYRIGEHVQEIGLSTATVQQLISIIIRGSYKKVVEQFLRFYAETSEFCRKAAAEALENDLSQTNGLILEQHVILFDLAIGFQNYMTSNNGVHSVVALVVSKAITTQYETNHCDESTGRAIQILKTLFKRGEDIAFKLEFSANRTVAGSTGKCSTMVKLFLNSNFLLSEHIRCFHSVPKAEALQFLTILNSKEMQLEMDDNRRNEIFALLETCLLEGKVALRKATYKMYLKMLDLVDNSKYKTVDDENRRTTLSLTQYRVLHIIRHHRHSPEEPEFLELCLALNIPFADRYVDNEWNHLDFSKVHGVSIRNACLLAKIKVRENFEKSDFYVLGKVGYYDDCYFNQPIPIEEYLTSNQILLLLNKFPILYRPNVYLGQDGWDLESLQQVLHLFSILLREVSFGKLAREKWDHGEFCTNMGITLLRLIIKPNVLGEASDLFPGKNPEFDYKHVDPRFGMVMAGMGEGMRQQLIVIAKKALVSRDEDFENLLEQIVSFLELSLTVTDREIIRTDEFIIRAKPCVKGLIPYFPLLACRLSTALTRAYLNPAEFGEHDFTIHSNWKKTSDVDFEKMSAALPERLNLTNSRPRVWVNRAFLFEKGIGDSIYDHHLYNNVEFWDWLTIRAFAVGYINEDNVYSTED